jgi:uncharacterized protein (DUF58 family)
MTPEADGWRGWMRLIATQFRFRIRYRVTKSGYLFVSALALVGIAAIASANNLLFLILAAMLAALMVSGFISRLCLAGLELEMALPEHIAARQSVTARLRLRNLKWFPSFAIHLSSRPGPESPILQKVVVFPTLPGRTTITVDVPAVFPRRGVHRENLFVVTTRFPFGFVERRVFVSIRSEVVIYPALTGSFALEEMLGDLRGEMERDQRGLGSDFYRLRPYEFHESARHVDWKSSAHTSELQVREFAREERSTVYVFFDLRGATGDAFEHSIESCAFAVWMLSGESIRVRFRTQRVDLTFPDQVDIYEILRALAMIQPMRQVEIPAVDEDDPHLLFSSAANEFVEAGWRVGRVVNAEEGREGE